MGLRRLLFSHVNILIEIISSCDVLQFVKKAALPLSFEQQMQLETAWDVAVRALGPLPNITVYHEETWEWTVVRKAVIFLQCCCHRFEGFSKRIFLSV